MELYQRVRADIARIRRSLMERKGQRMDGGPGSGNFGHSGRPGKVGGSAKEGTGAKGSTAKKSYAKSFSKTSSQAPVTKPQKTWEEMSDIAYESAEKCRKMRVHVIQAESEASKQIKKRDEARSALKSAEMKLDNTKYRLEVYKDKVKNLDTGRTLKELTDLCEQKQLEKERAWYRYLEKGMGDKETKEAFEKAYEEYTRLSDEKSAKEHLERVTEILEESQSELKKAKQRMTRAENALKKTGYGQLMQEYEEMAKQRDEAILATFESAGDCMTQEDASDYLRAKGYFRKKGESAFDADARVDIDMMTGGYAVACATRIGGFMEDYPFLRGEFESVDCHDFNYDPDSAHLAGTYAYVSYDDAGRKKMCFARGYFGDPNKVSQPFRNDAETAYNKDVESHHHPPGTGYQSIIDHEMTHALEKVVAKKAEEKEIPLHDGKVANEIMKRVMTKLSGDYAMAAEKSVREMVSVYAAENEGISEKYGENRQYGRNTEWLAEAMAEARCSKEPRKIAVAVKEAMDELIKEVGLS